MMRCLKRKKASGCGQQKRLLNCLTRSAVNYIYFNCIFLSETGCSMHYEIITVVAADVGRRFHTGVQSEAKSSRSAPSYTDILPKYRELAHDLITVNGKKVHTVTKFYEPDTVVVEGHSIVEDLFSKEIVDFKKSMLAVCSDLARKRDHFADIYE